MDQEGQQFLGCGRVFGLAISAEDQLRAGNRAISAQ